MVIEFNTREVLVNGKQGYFHTWEHFSEPLKDSKIVWGAPCRTISKIFGIVEFKDGTVERVEPTSIKFIDIEELKDEYKGEYKSWKKETN